MPHPCYHQIVEIVENKPSVAAAVVVASVVAAAAAATVEHGFAGC